MAKPAKATPLQPRELPAVVGQIEDFLRKMIEGLAPEPPRTGRGAPRVLPAMCLWAGLLVCVLYGFQSQTELWRLLCVHGLWSYPRFEVGDQAVRNRLAAGGKELEHLFQQITKVLALRLAPYANVKLAAFAAGVVVLDQTTLDRVARKLKWMRGKLAELGAVLPGKLSCLFDLRLQQWVRVEYVANPAQNEKVLANRMVKGLPRRTLILADLGFFSFAWFDGLTDRKYYWISRFRAGTSYIVRHTFYEDEQVRDVLIWLGAHRADRARHAVRLVEFSVGGTRFQYITNVTDPRKLPIAEIAELYARRWDIEMAFQFIKRELNLHLIWSAKTEVVLQQVWAVLIISQILQGLRNEIAARAGVDVFDVSLPLLVRSLPRFAERGEDPVQAVVERGRFAKIIRPARRVKIQAPRIRDEDIVPLPEGLELTRTPRHAGRKCGPRKKDPATKKRAPAGAK